MLTKMPHQGSLTLIMGPMFSGKTSTLMHHIGNALQIGKVLFLIPQIDNRCEDTIVSSHNPHIKLNDLKFEIRRVNDLDAIKLEDVNDYLTICIDEAQFFNSLTNNIIRFVEEYNKDVFIAGLSGTYERKPFSKSDFLNLIPLADTVIYLSKDTYCSRCISLGKRNKALFTHKISTFGDNKSEILIGGSEEYQPVCRTCYIALNK